MDTIKKDNLRVLQHKGCPHQRRRLPTLPPCGQYHRRGRA